MRIDFGSLAFNINVNGRVGGTPSWGTAIVYQTEENKIKEDMSRDILVGMVYKKIDCTSHKLSIPLGKGGHVYYGDEDYQTNGAPSEPYLAAYFEKTYVNGKYVGKPFILLVVKDGYDAHNGRLQLKYSPKIKWDNYSNQEFFEQVYEVLNIDSDAPLLFYDISVKNQDSLHFKCAYKDDSYVFQNRNEFNLFIQDAINNDDSHEVKNWKSHLPTKQTIYYGAPGSGKSHAVKLETGEIDDDGNEIEKPNVFRVTFHPDTDYASFVGCYKPVPEDDDEKITYKFVFQAFSKAYIAAWSDLDTPYYLVIEEINRGNCAQIFGDIFQLLDRDINGYSEYPINADEDLCKELEQNLGVGHIGIAGKKLRLPSNLHILATMNTSDQSLFPMDSAFKRRWSWKYVPIEYDEDISSNFVITIDDEHKYYWVDFLEAANEEILGCTDSEDKQMGNFFIKSNIDKEEFKSKVMFYLWSEVGKENYKTNNALFKDEDGDEFTFNDLYKDGGDDILISFIERLINDNEVE